jgi:hypothetical protein
MAKMLKGLLSSTTTMVEEKKGTKVPVATYLPPYVLTLTNLHAQATTTATATTAERAESPGIGNEPDVLYCGNPGPIEPQSHKIVYEQETINAQDLRRMRSPKEKGFMFGRVNDFCF